MDNRDGLALLDYVMGTNNRNNMEFMRIHQGFATVNNNFDKLTKAINNHSKAFKYVIVEFILFGAICYTLDKNIRNVHKRVAILESKSKMEEHKKTVEDMLQ